MAQRLSIEPRQIIEVHSPATLEKIGEVEIDSPLDVRAAARRAREAFRVWGAMDFKSRAKVLLSARDSLIAHGEELIELICRENGKPRLEALVEITYVCDALTFYSKRARRFLRSHRLTPHLLRNKKGTVHYQPRGVIGNTPPLHFPSTLSLPEPAATRASVTTLVFTRSVREPLTALP